MLLLFLLFEELKQRFEGSVGQERVWEVTTGVLAVLQACSSGVWLSGALLPCPRASLSPSPAVWKKEQGGSRQGFSAGWMV